MYMKTWILYRNQKRAHLIKTGIKRIDKFLVFKLNKQHHVALISELPDIVPTFMGFGSAEMYYIFENDQNTFNIETGSILDAKLEKDWRQHLEEHPEHKHLTAKAKSPETATPHQIIEDIAHISLNGQVLKNLISKVKGQALNDYILPFVAGLGAGIILLVLLSAFFPDQIFVQLGSAPVQQPVITQPVG